MTYSVYQVGVNMSLIKQIADEMTVNEVRGALMANAKFAKYDDGFTKGRIFRDQVLAKTHELGMSANEIVTEYLRSNGCVGC
jgi:hypothetical protein